MGVAALLGSTPEVLSAVAGAVVALRILGVKVRMLYTSEKDDACNAVVERFVARRMPGTSMQSLGDIMPPRARAPISVDFVKGWVPHSLAASTCCFMHERSSTETR